MKAYSIDLRQKIVDIYEEGQISQRRLAKQFQVAPSFVEKLIRQMKETGSIAPKIRTVQTPCKLNEEQLIVLEQIVLENNDATLAEIREILLQKTNVSIGISTVDRMLHRLNLTFKKKLFIPRKKRQIECKGYGLISGS